MRIEFDKQIERLKNSYGANAYSSNRIELFWEWLNLLAAKDFESAVSKLIASERQPPMLNQFVELVLPKLQVSKKLQEEASAIGRKECAVCDSKGFVFKTMMSKKLQRNYEYIFRCECEWGKKYTAWPLLSDVTAYQGKDSL